MFIYLLPLLQTQNILSDLSVVSWLSPSLLLSRRAFCVRLLMFWIRTSEAGRSGGAAQRALLAVAAKLSGDVRGPGQVATLLRQATDNHRLSKLFPGWQPYLWLFNLSAVAVLQYLPRTTEYVMLVFIYLFLYFNCKIYAINIFFNKCIIYQTSLFIM